LGLDEVEVKELWGILKIFSKNYHMDVLSLGYGCNIPQLNQGTLLAEKYIISKFYFAN
jgi:hypothetical protein